MPEDQGGAGASQTDTTQDTQTTAGAADATSHTADTAAQTRPDTSANKLIKDFAKAEGISVEELLDQYKTLRDANRTDRERLESELNTHKTRAEQAEQRLRDATARSAASDAASKAGAISPKAVYALIRGDIEYDATGEPTNIADLIEQAKADEPQLFRAAAGSGDGGKGGASPNATDINQVFRQMAGRP